MASLNLNREEIIGYSVASFAVIFSLVIIIGSKI